MTFSSTSLFSFRNLLLIALASFTVRSLGITLVDPTFPTEDLTTLQSGELEQVPPSIIDAFLQGSSAGNQIEIIPVFAERSTIEEILAGSEHFILTSDSEVNPRAWLSYLAPEGFSFDITMLNATIALQSLAAGSQAFFNETASLEISPSSFEGQPLNIDTQAPFEVFFGIDLSSVASSQIELSTFGGEGLPTHSISDFQSPGRIPEPTATLLLLIALAHPLLRRKRQ